MNIQSDYSDEIICTNCGRPNLPEAVKCWYCQSPLEHQDGSEAELTEFSENQPGPQKQEPAREQTRNYEEEIPEWLKRIRENEQKEKEAEEAEDQWQQQALFNGSSEKHDESSQSKREVHKAAGIDHEKTPKNEHPVNQPKLDVEQPAEPAEQKSEIIDEEDEKDPEIITEDLPDGFIKFDKKSN